MTKARRSNSSFKMKNFNADYQAMSGSTCDPVILLLGTNRATLETVFESLLPSTESRRLSRPVDPPYYVKENIAGSLPKTVLPPVVNETSQNSHERPLREIIQKVIELVGEIQCLLFVWNAAEIRFGLDEKSLFENLKKTVGDDAMKQNAVMLLLNADVLLQTDRLEDFVKQPKNESLQKIYTQLEGKMFAIREETDYQGVIQPAVSEITKPITRTLYPYPLENIYQTWIFCSQRIQGAISRMICCIRIAFRRVVSLLLRCK